MEDLRMATYILGKDCKMYVGTTLFTTTPYTYGSMTEVGNVTDVTTTLDTNEEDVTTRENSGWDATVATSKKADVSFDMVWKPSDTNFQALRDAFLNSTEVAAAVMSGGITTPASEGLSGNFTVTKFSRTEPVKGAVKAAVTIKPSGKTHWYTVPAA
jgi:hypothetical protein